MKPSKNVRTKIAVGYALIIVVCILSVGYVYRQVERFTGPDDSRMQVQSRRSLVNQTLYHLYQAEGYGQFLIAGYPSYERRYRDELQVVRQYLDSLGAWGAVGSDSLQRIRLDSISSLIGVKERSTLGLQRTIRSSGTATLLSRNIEQLLPPDTLRADTAIRQVVQQDTVSVPRRKRGFFRRLGDVFSPPKEDSSVVISTRVVVDSLPPAAVKDTIAGVLRDLQDRVNSQRLEIYQRAWNDGNALKYSNQQINEKIYRLLNDFEQEETAYLMVRMNERAEVRRRSSLILGGIAATALVLMLVFVGMLWRDIGRSNRYKRELEELNRTNEALLAAREKLMLTITHDIKAPLGAIMGYIDLLLRFTDGKREALYLRNMKASADHLLGLVGNLLDFYRLDAHKVEVSRVAFSPAELFAQVGAGFAPVAAGKGIALHTQISASAECEVAGDPLRIRQITDNLLSNALKFTDRGSVTIAADLRDGNLVFSVTDSPALGGKQHISALLLPGFGNVSLQAEHLGLGGAVHVRVEDAHAVAHVVQGDGQVRRDGGFAHAPLSRSDGQDAADPAGEGLAFCRRGLVRRILRHDHGHRRCGICGTKRLFGLPADFGCERIPCLRKAQCDEDRFGRSLDTLHRTGRYDTLL